jgi:hypothetical protein
MALVGAVGLTGDLSNRRHDVVLHCCSRRTIPRDGEPSWGRSGTRTGTGAAKRSTGAANKFGARGGAAAPGKFVGRDGFGKGRTVP